MQLFRDAYGFLWLDESDLNTPIPQDQELLPTWERDNRYLRRLIGGYLELGRRVISPVLIPGFNGINEKSSLIDRRSTLIEIVAAMREANVPGAREIWYRLQENNGIGHAWWWQVAAVSNDAVNQLSWADREVDCMNDALRKRGRWSVFLKKAKLYGLDIADEDATAICEYIGKNITNDTYSYDVVYGQGVYDAYQTGPHSCMKGEVYVDFYSKNPEKVGMVRLFKWNEYMGRALLWNLDDGRKFMDRIYPSDGGLHIPYIKSIADAAGWDYLDVQSFSERPRSGLTARVSGMGNTSHFPFMDTLRYTDNESYDDEIDLNSYHGCYLLQSTEGQHPNGDEDNDEDNHDGDLWSHYQNCYIDEDYACTVCINARGDTDCVNEDTRDSDFRYVSRHGDHYHIDDVTECYYTDEYCLDDDVTETYEGHMCDDRRVTRIDLGDDYADTYAYDEDPKLCSTASGLTYIEGDYVEEEEEEAGEPVKETNEQEETSRITDQYAGADRSWLIVTGRIPDPADLPGDPNDYGH